MAGLSASSWVILFIGCIIFFGGSTYTLLIAMGKDPNKYLEQLGITGKMDSAGEKSEELGIYKPFEYMERGNSEKAQGCAVVLVLLLISWWAGAFEEAGEEEPMSSAGDANFEFVNSTWSNSDYTAEGSETEVDDQFEARVERASFVLTWTDDDTTEGNIGGTGVQNQPDTFRLTVVSPNGTEYQEEAANDVSTEDGEIIIDVFLGLTEREREENWVENFEKGGWNITVECVEAGDSRDNLGLYNFQDDGNDWTLSVSYAYFDEVQLI